jgi:hypothetical protein
MKTQSYSGARTRQQLGEVDVTIKKVVSDVERVKRKEISEQERTKNRADKDGRIGKNLQDAADKQREMRCQTIEC